MMEIEANMNVPQHRQRLVHEARVMQFDEPLRTYNVREGSTVFLLLSSAWVPPRLAALTQGHRHRVAKRADIGRGRMESVLEVAFAGDGFRGRGGPRSSICSLGRPPPLAKAKRHQLEMKSPSHPQRF
ncbi:hypothetical protein GGTG_00138 [Gaeumannomyces tritici R3-111a-1]|uniref:Ubiquitin-like domain-containing protein n=1 Tax=Gaeumannomyces tritici (strain R3-111a-1) TaxID=644352 RepID=J3NFU4_GAET3|nr:hypothetical protein GGTG_00138 [Gaeumannomyces tritici R3-111a-1]EJT80134.1 hypothetical protein GGTG_00138 [Gaeumannomyces tritici R3-111a-1]